MSTSTSASRCNGRPRSSAPPRSQPRCGLPRRAAGSGSAPACRHPQGHSQGHRDALVRTHMPLADRIAAGFHRRYGDLVELDDLRQEARLELVRAAARAEGPRPEPYLRRCIAGALCHHLRDRALLLRLPAKRRDAAPWRHTSLDASLPGEEGALEGLVIAPEPVPPEEDDPEPSLSPELETLLTALPELQRTVVRLTVLEGWSQRLTAQHLGLSPTTVQRARKAALATLRQRLEAQSQPTKSGPGRRAAAESPAVSPEEWEESIRLSA
jgi:RNA polymerase sigma-B factor